MMQCIVVEDEPLAVDVLTDYIRQVPSLNLIASCSEALQAMDLLKKHSVDLMFLDIHLPGLKGLEFLETLTHPPQVILTTAYHEYALKSYEHNVVDYLLKPIAFKRFVQAVQKVDHPRNPGRILAIHSEKKTALIPLDDILYIESQKEYVRIQTTTGTHVSKYALSKLETELDAKLFLRVHRSFIVALNKVTAFKNLEVEVSGKAIPVGGNYREVVGAAMGRIVKS